MKKTYQAINWNAPTHQFYDELYTKQVQQFWLPEEIPVSDDKSIWETLDPQIKSTYEKILAGLTLLDTEQAHGIQKVGDATGNLFIQSIMALFAGFESIHARSYSTIFQTLCSTERIDELFEWVEQTPSLQVKVGQIVSSYEGISSDESLFLSMVGSLCLEGICFYSGFFLPLWLAGQGKMVNSGEIINLILRDEKLHTKAVGFFAKEQLDQLDPALQVKLKESAKLMMLEVYELEMAYSKELYENLDLLEDVRTYVQFNVNYACECLGLDPLFKVTEAEVNAIVLNGYSVETKNHDFFSTKGNGYIKTTHVTPLSDEDFVF